MPFEMLVLQTESFVLGVQWEGDGGPDDGCKLPVYLRRKWLCCNLGAL
jgi:hypothetical protein